MKRFKEFLDEGVISNYNGTKLIGTIHYNDRAVERSVKEASVKHVFRQTVDHMADHGHKYGNEFKFLVYSKKYDQAVVFDHRKEKPQYGGDDKKHLVICTVLKKGDQYANKQTRKIVVENYDEGSYSPEFLAFVSSLIDGDQLTEHYSEVDIDGLHVSDEGESTLTEGNQVRLVFVDGQLSNIPYHEFIEVD